MVVCCSVVEFISDFNDRDRDGRWIIADRDPERIPGLACTHVLSARRGLVQSSVSRGDQGVV